LIKIPYFRLLSYQIVRYKRGVKFITKFNYGPHLFAVSSYLYNNLIILSYKKVFKKAMPTKVNSRGHFIRKISYSRRL